MIATAIAQELALLRHQHQAAVDAGYSAVALDIAADIADLAAAREVMLRLEQPEAQPSLLQKCHA